MSIDERLRAASGAVRTGMEVTAPDPAVIDRRVGRARTVRVSAGAVLALVALAVGWPLLTGGGTDEQVVAGGPEQTLPAWEPVSGELELAVPEGFAVVYDGSTNDPVSGTFLRFVDMRSDDGHGDRIIRVRRYLATGETEPEQAPTRTPVPGGEHWIWTVDAGRAWLSVEAIGVEPATVEAVARSVRFDPTELPCVDAPADPRCAWGRHEWVADPALVLGPARPMTDAVLSGTVGGESWQVDERGWISLGGRSPVLSPFVDGGGPAPLPGAPEELTIFVGGDLGFVRSASGELVVAGRMNVPTGNRPTVVVRTTAGSFEAELAQLPIEGLPADVWIFAAVVPPSTGGPGWTVAMDLFLSDGAIEQSVPVIAPGTPPVLEGADEGLHVWCALRSQCGLSTAPVQEGGGVWTAVAGDLSCAPVVATVDDGLQVALRGGLFFTLTCGEGGSDHEAGVAVRFVTPERVEVVAVGWATGVAQGIAPGDEFLVGR